MSQLRKEYLDNLQASVRQVEALRRHKENPQDISFAQYVKSRYQTSMESFLSEIGVNPAVDTIANLFSLPEEGYDWLVPEIVRDALRLGLRKAPIYPGIVASEQSVNGLTITMPHVNMSDAMPEFVGEAETIPLGTVSYGQKQLTLRKMGRGIKIPYEVRDYVSLNVVSIYLQDFGVKLGLGQDALLVDCLINGEQADGSESAPVVGTATGTSLAYKDLVKVWVRMARIGRNPVAMIAGETFAVDMLDLAEFKNRNTGSPDHNLRLKTPIPTTSDLHIHGSVPADQVIVIDPSSAVIKFNAQPLLVETDKIVSNQTEETYASLTTGYGIAFRDARIIVDRSIAFSGNGFPSYMNVDPLESEKPS